MNELLSFSSDVEIVEILLVVGVSFIGACVHEYIFRQNNQRYFFKNPNIWISTVVSSILCYIVNPWIINFNPRLVLLPPLLFGLAGMDLVMRLATVKGSTSILEYLLGFLGIKNQKEDEHYGAPDIETNNTRVEEKTNESTTEAQPVMNTEEFERLVNLDQMVQTSLDSICNLLVEYYVRHDRAAFLRGYNTVKLNLDLLHHTLLSYQLVPIATTLKLSEILKKKIEIDTVYHELTSLPE